MPQGMQGSHFGTPAAAICKQGLFCCLGNALKAT